MVKKKSALVRLGSTSITIQDVNDKKSRELRTAAKGLAQVKRSDSTRAVQYQADVVIGRTK